MKRGRAGDVRRWLSGEGGDRAAELSLRSGERYMSGFPLAVGRRMLAFERWSREALVPISIELIPLLDLESVARHVVRTQEVDALPDLETRRAFFGAHETLRGIDLDSRSAALESLRVRGHHVNLLVDEGDGIATLRGRLRHVGGGLALFEWEADGQEGSPTLVILRIATIVRIGFGSAACERAAARARKRDEHLDGLAEAIAGALPGPTEKLRASPLVPALVGEHVEVALETPPRDAEGRLVALGLELFCLEEPTPDGSSVLTCHPIEDVGRIDVPAGGPRRGKAVPDRQLPSLDDLLPALREAQRLWGGLVLEVLLDEPAEFLVEVLEVGERGLFLRLVTESLDRPTYGQLWVDPRAVLAFGKPTRPQLEILRRAARAPS